MNGMNRESHILSTYIPDGVPVKREGNIFSFSVSPDALAEVCREFYFTHALQLQTITAVDDRSRDGGFRILYVFGVPGENMFLIPFITLKGKEEFPSITLAIHEASGYERKIRSLFGLHPEGHPRPRPMLLHENWPGDRFPLRRDFPWRERPAEARGEYPFQKVEGEGIYEIPVGPVHAGIIEPGHFRFSVAGEEVVKFEPKLGYKHKGIEKLFEVLSLPEKVKLSERVSGDTSFSHSLAFCQALEQLSGTEVPLRAKYLRVVFSELERLANHFNDIGFIMMDTGFAFGGISGTRLREAIMLWNDRLTGSRFLRGVNAIGGVMSGIDPATGEELLAGLEKIHRDFNEVIEISEGSDSLLNRLSGTGKLDREIALDHGVIGVAGRAVGISHDARREYPYAAYDTIPFDPALENDGDVRARWHVRIREVRSSMAILRQALTALPREGDLCSGTDIALRSDGIGIGVTEGWRGAVVYLVITDSTGNVIRVDVRDPSFLNWTAVEYAVKGDIVPDFPLINKSFNLSYSGNDV
jgi:Ni,Fe-hydrogenase III large subunit/Ni,Fe-hydrogenase III component G